MSMEGGDGRELLNVSWQVIPRLCSCDRKRSRSEGTEYAWYIESPFLGWTYTCRWDLPV